MRSRSASGLAAWVSARRRGGAEKDAEKQRRGRGGSGIQAFAGWRSQRRARVAEVRASLGCTRRSLMPLVLAALLLPAAAPLLGAGFTIARWEAGRLAVYEADENAIGGRPFLGGVEILLGRAPRDQASDLDLGKADVVELGPNELRRQPAGRRIWTSSPVRVLALVFAPHFEDRSE